ncbi:histidine kinase sensor domain-containing protein [Shewanella electrodiphila]|uniref:histidine kinase n=1 Tax=Shewanella electrodiphila TaxID=934143 RepID=A0ABT0KNA2_9GAMM|nr:histidine kinase sensor domain-containing protein [Shewanella electrodiphila]MCL1045332.1 histidine kinase sensor domain-containing protein [Shewanella electrodiphila]
MNRKILWKLCFIIATGLVAFFYMLQSLTTQTEEQMSFIADNHQLELQAWANEAEHLLQSGQHSKLDDLLTAIQQQENTWVSIAGFKTIHIAGERPEQEIVGRYHFGRSVDWKIHLYFESNPIMELPFKDNKASLLIRLPERMRPGNYWGTTRILLQVLIPMMILIGLSILLYRHIITPLQRLDKATSAFSEGNFNVRVKKHLGNRNDEFSHLAETFDQMACQIGELISNQRDLISDLSHELRTPLTRLDIAVNSFEAQDSQYHIARISRESQHIRKLVEDTLTLAWLDNEKPIIKQEDVDLVDLLDVLVEDARFEYPDRRLILDCPNNAVIHNSSHKALAPAIENIIRNALRYTPVGQSVQVGLTQCDSQYIIIVHDQGPGIPEQYLNRVFQPFFRVDNSRITESDNFGLGLALAKRHLNSVRANISAYNQGAGGLAVKITIPVA